MRDTSLKWYTYINARPAGPLSAKEIVQKIQSGELNFGSHVWKDGYQGWTRLYDVIDFKPLLPAEPPASLIAEIQKSFQGTPPPLSPRQKEELRTWFIYLEDSNYGPVSDIEVVRMFELGQVNGATYMWKKGFSDWQQAATIPDWSQQIGALKNTEAKLPSDKRSAPRKPFEAKVLLTDGKEVGWAVCRDISVGGMQVLMDRSPGQVGTILKLNVNSHGPIPSFACEGTIVRILEDGRGFSFRFSALSAEAKSAIEKYITQ